LLEQQGLEKFLELTGNVYPDLVKVFFTHLKVKEDRLETKVKGVTMKITPSIWMEDVGIKCEGLKVIKGNISALEDFNKIHFFRSCLRNQHAPMKGFHVSGLAMNSRIIAFIIVWIITPRNITILSYMKKTSY